MRSVRNAIVAVALIVAAIVAAATIGALVHARAQLDAKVYVITDKKTCLQYLIAPGAGIAPRRDTTGNHMLGPSCTAALEGE